LCCNELLRAGLLTLPPFRVSVGVCAKKCRSGFKQQGGFTGREINEVCGRGVVDLCRALAPRKELRPAKQARLKYQAFKAGLYGSARLLG